MKKTASDSPENMRDEVKTKPENKSPDTPSSIEQVQANALWEWIDPHVVGLLIILIPLSFIDWTSLSACQRFTPLKVALVGSGLLFVFPQFMLVTRAFGQDKGKKLPYFFTNELITVLGAIIVGLILFFK